MKGKNLELNEIKKVRPGLDRKCSTPKSDYKNPKDFSENMEEVYERRFKTKLEKVKKLNHKGEKYLLEYINFKKSQGLTHYRLLRVLDFFYNLMKTFDIDFSKINQKDVEDIMIWIHKQDWKDWTKYTYASVFRNFLYWLVDVYKIDVNPRRMKISSPKNSLMPDYLITKEEFNKLINGAMDPQTKLIIGILYESACRIGEIFSLKIQNVEFNQYGAKLHVKGKTGQRVVPIVWFAGMLREFYESHPLKDNPEAPLFYYKNSKGEIVPLKYEVIKERLKRICKRVGINKRIYPHLFRHSRLTELARKVPDSVLKRFAGWSMNSRMVKTYIHLSARDVEDTLLSNVYGVKTSKEEEGEKFKVCPKCGELNPPFAKICHRCKTPLDEKEILETMITKEQIKEINDWSEVFLTFFKIMEEENPEIWSKIMKILKEKGKDHLIKKKEN